MISDFEFSNDFCQQFVFDFIFCLAHRRRVKGDFSRRDFIHSAVPGSEEIAGQAAQDQSAGKFKNTTLSMQFTSKQMSERECSSHVCSEIYQC